IHSAIRTIEPKDSVARYTELGVNCVMGEARLLDKHHVRVGSEVLSTRNIVLATGAVPVVPPIDGLNAASPLTSDNLWELQTLPRRLLVLGGGPIGCELAQSFARLGSQVTLIDMESALLPREDPDASTFIADVLRTEGVDVRLAHKAVRVADHCLFAETAQGEVAIEFDRILVALGRRAHTESLGLEAVGLRPSADGTLPVDAYLRTAEKNIFACGDLIGPYQFTHMASHQAWYAAVNALFGRFWKFKVNYSVVPWATYTDPEVARVGLSETEAFARGLAVDVVRYDLDDLDRAIVDGTAQGWVKVITPKGKDQILGATIVGAHAGELIGELVLAMTHGLGLKKIMGTIHIYPTLNEANKFVAGSWRRKNAPERLIGWVEKLHTLLR
ncbi:MAG: FAD-dependent oxidoreductase, partial [Gammaproteobacteria bacterium]|nr:FAD-dependent oxidoreductase [Gammaproteobacteria bacterium]